MSDTPETNEATTPGELLKLARERAGLSVERVAKDLYLDVHVIQAIEVNRFKDLGAPVYAKGYLRRYAKLVGVNEETVLKGYQQMGGTPVSDPIPAAMGTVLQSRKPLPRWVWWCVIGLLVLAGLMTLLNLRSTDTENVQQGALISQPLNAPGSSAVDPASPPAEMLTVEFSFSGDSWVEVRNASDVQMVKEFGIAGSAWQIQATPPLRVVLSAANAVSMQVNSKAVTVPEKNINNGAANFVIKPDGLLE